MDKAGGALKLAVHFGYKSTQGVYYWRQRGIPHALREEVAGMAGVDLNLVDELSNAAAAKRLLAFQKAQKCKGRSRPRRKSASSKK